MNDRSQCHLRFVLPALVALVAGTAARADVVLPAVFGDGMVLQRETAAPVWGWADPGEQIRVRGDWGAAAETTADARGRWSVRLDTPGAGGPHRVEVAGRTTIALDDVLVGDVWLCGGQSNMEWPLAQTDGAEAAIAAADRPTIRLFTVENRHAARPRADVRGAWAPCTPATARTFSAVGYHFAVELRRDIDVPVGLVSADWGGTVAEAWMSREGLRAFPEFDAALETLDLAADPSSRTGILATRRDAWWTALDRLSKVDPDWASPDFDDGGWDEATLPGPLGDFDGVVYYRLTIELGRSVAAAGATLELGPIDDYDDVWVNGEHVGGVHDAGRWNEPRRYALPATVLRPGTNVIAVRVLDTAGPGGLHGAPDALRLIPRGTTPGSTRRPIGLAGTWITRRGVAAGALPSMPESAELGHNLPTMLHNAMIAPLAPYALRGVLFYQGESNRMRAEQYRDLFPALIADWRRVFDRPELPFYFVQIAPFRYGGDTGQAALLRDAQRRALRLPHTGMAVTLDVGDPADIHPRDKRSVGRRLALLALAGTYGRDDVVPSGPLYAGMEVEGDAIRLRFDHADGGLELRPVARGQFLVKTWEDGAFHVAEARVEGETVLVQGPAGCRPYAVRYAWEAAPEASLFGPTGLPASPFRTDDMKGPPPPISNDAAVTRHRSTEPGFTNLFATADLSGWVNVNGAPSTWSVGADGVLHCSGAPICVLRTEAMYENFVLELEWRHLKPGGNAGVFAWSDPIPARGQPYTRGVEVQVLDGIEGSWYTSDGDIFPIHGSTMRPENHRGGSRAFPTERRSNPSPLWNHYRIECRDGSISLAVNGKVVTRGHDARPRKGYICLESEGSPVEFRHVRLKVLPDGPPLATDDVAEPARGFRTLYDGVSLDGWKTEAAHEGHWRPADWRLDFDGAGPDLWSTESFGDFELICDWRWSGPPTDTERPVIRPDGLPARDADGNPRTAVVPDAGDSGIYLRGSSKSQVNIWCWPIGSGEVYGYRTDASMSAEVRAGVTPSAVADAEIGKWNRFHITMVGERLTVVLNGVTVIENARLPGVATTGPIALQNHGAPIQFANIYVRELDGTN